MVKKLNLAGTWTLQCDELSIPSAIPGDAISALLAANIIPDPYRRDNETRVQRWREKTWTFSRTVTLDDAWLAHRELVLSIASLDTVATITLNGVRIAESSNQFIPLFLDVKPFLHAGENTLSITCTPAHHVAAERAEAVRAALGIDIAAPVSDNNRIPNMNFLRKVQCHAGWDWGPCLLTCGIYGEIALVASDTAIVRGIDATPRHVTGGWEIPVCVHLSHAEDVACTISLNGETHQLHGTMRTTSFFIPDDQAHLWFPRGMGEQALYTIHVATADSEYVRRIGLRELIVRRDKDAIGTSFTVTVNGLPVFCRGANWIPVDALPAHQTPDVYRRLLDDACRANMNMLRIWGGGQWESDAFYDQCDALGILLWHDCMFACMHYPSTPEFLDDITRELSIQIRRLATHPSIALWCGDNECFGLCAGGDGEARPEFVANYKKFSAAVAAAVKTADPSRLFWPSSPCNGEDSPPGSWHDDTTGDMHFWYVWHGSKPFEAYRTVRPRFCSEFGFQAYPSAYTVAWMCEGEEPSATSPTMLCHQKNTGGNMRITAMFDQTFGQPKTFADSVYLSQAQQALAIETAISAWRGTKPVCMGTLYWQLNDNWPAVSWSSVDYFGCWKILHCHARRFYAPVAAFAQVDNATHTIDFRAVNDTPAPIDATLTVTEWTFDGTVRGVATFQACIPCDRAITIGTCSYNTNADAPTFFAMELVTANGSVHTTCFPTALKACPVRPATIHVEKTTNATGQTVLKLTADAPAFFVFITSPTGRLVLSDNSLTLLPGIVRDIVVEDGNADTLIVQQLADTRTTEERNASCIG